MALRELVQELDVSWRSALAAEAELPYVNALDAFIAEEESRGPVFPPLGMRFSALVRTPLDRVRAVIIGQDPYIRPGQAHGLSFSVPRGVPKPPSLRNVLKELSSDLDLPDSQHGCLEAWADRGVLMLNAVLTVREGQSDSHAGRGWERFTDAVLRAVAERREHAAFLLWGAKAAKKIAGIDASRHLVHVSAHPSPLARGAFFGSRPFSTANRFLQYHGAGAIDWRLSP